MSVRYEYEENSGVQEGLEVNHRNVFCLRKKQGRRLEMKWHTTEGKIFNLLKPTGHVMHQQFNIQQLYVLPTLYLCVLYLSENKQRHFPLKQIGFYNRDE
jgi:hypothetical protein